MQQATDKSTNKTADTQAENPDWLELYFLLGGGVLALLLSFLLFIAFFFLFWQGRGLKPRNDGPTGLSSQANSTAKSELPSDPKTEPASTQPGPPGPPIQATDEQNSDSNRSIADSESARKAPSPENAEGGEEALKANAESAFKSEAPENSTPDAGERAANADENSARETSPNSTENGLKNEKEAIPDGESPREFVIPLSEVALELEQAAIDARELTENLSPNETQADLGRVRGNLSVEPGQTPSLDIRDPRLRSELLEEEGGTIHTEAAVARGLRWLASVQNQDGSWSLENYERHSQPNNEGDAAATSLALLPFLGAGQTQESGKYKEVISKGLSWLIAHQEANGDLRANCLGLSGMYAHGQGTIVLCEAFAMTRDAKLRTPTRLAVQFIERAQHEEGGWRYEPGEPGDTSVFGWQLMALQSARATKGVISVNKNTLKLADAYLDSATNRPGQSRIPPGALYRYLPYDGMYTPSMTAEGLLCRMYLGWNRDNPGLKAGVSWLVDEYLPNQRYPDIYYWYYGTQVLHHYGGEEWNKWNFAIRDLLVESQQRTGKHSGSWEPTDFERGNTGGRIFVTSLAVCTLEVYYRYLPLFKPLRLKE